MKVLFAVNYPLSWAKGGFTVQIEQTGAALRKAGVEVEWVDYSGAACQNADIIHYWGSPSSETIWNVSPDKGLKRVITYLAPRGMITPSFKEFVERGLRQGLGCFLGKTRLFARMGIGLENADAYILLNSAEQKYVNFMYNWSREKCHIIPNGVNDCFFNPKPALKPINGLLYPSYICPRKNQVEIAKIAKKEKVTVYFVGGAQGESPAYFEKFKREIDGEYAVWLGEISSADELATLYRASLGTFLASDYDNQGIVLLEALACGKSVMGPELSNLKSFFGDSIQYCPSAKSRSFAEVLKRFDAFCRAGGKQTKEVSSWSDIGQQVLSVYQTV